MYEYSMVTRDANDYERRPPSDTPKRLTIEYAGATTATVPADVVKRHAESSPENPQGGRWVKLRVDAGGVQLGHAQMVAVLEQHGYQRDPPGDKSGT